MYDIYKAKNPTILEATIAKATSQWACSRKYLKIRPKTCPKTYLKTNLMTNLGHILGCFWKLSQTCPNLRHLNFSLYVSLQEKQFKTMIQNTVIYFGMYFFSIRKHNLGTYIINRVNEIVLIKYLYFHINII